MNDPQSFPERLREGQCTPREAEAYVAGLYDALLLLGEDDTAKSYDPLAIDDDFVAHSYVLDLWDGGRHRTIPSAEILVHCAKAELLCRLKKLVGPEIEIQEDFLEDARWHARARMPAMAEVLARIESA